MYRLLTVVFLLFPITVVRADDHREIIERARRIVFLGDSITAAGQYVAYVDTWLLTQSLKQRPVVIDAGLPSETVSGLSEEGHAGGAFPRPDLAERLDRVLALTKPDLVIACYGINCGIYQPFDEKRFQRYQYGMQQLKNKVEKAKARLIVMTPPCFDDQRAGKSFSYNAVLSKYANWLVAQRDKGWLVIDLHSAMTGELSRQRQTNTQFTFQPDAVHPNDTGHWFIACQIMRWFGDYDAAKHSTPQQMLQAKQIPVGVLSLVQQRVNLLRDAYVHTAGHKRPGVASGLPLPEAENKAQLLTAKIESMLAK